MTLAVHGIDLPDGPPPSRLWRFFSWLGGWSWQRSIGVGVDEDGEVDGTGILIRLELPLWLATPIRRWTYDHMPEWMKVQRQSDISDVLLASLLVAPAAGAIDVLGGSHSRPQTITWVDDRLAPRPWRPE